MHNALKCILHMLCLVYFIIVPFIMKTQYRYSEFIYHIRINFAIIVNSSHTDTTTRDICNLFSSGEAWQEDHIDLILG